jgi:hypothetical protein
MLVYVYRVTMMDTTVSATTGSGLLKLRAEIDSFTHRISLLVTAAQAAMAVRGETNR